MTTAVAFGALQAVMLCLLGAQLWFAVNTHPVMRTLLQLEAFYTLLGVVVRPTYQFVTKPGPSGFLYDNRLVSSDYRDLVTLVAVALVGQAAFLIGIVVCVKSSVFLGSASPGSYVSLWYGAVPMVIVGLYLFEWVARLASLTGSVVVAESLLPFGTPVACLAVMLIPRDAPYRLTILIGAGAGEAIWALLFASKTPIIAILIAFLMRVNLLGDKRTIRRAYVLLLASLIGCFLVLQPLRGIETATRESGSGGLGGYSGGAALSVLERFDAMTSLADAYYLRKTWLTGGELLARAEAAAFPHGPSATPEASIGQRWTREVRSVTVPYQYQGVPIAAGPTAEGFALARTSGMVIEQALTALLFCMVSWGLSAGGMVRRFYWAYFAFSSTLFELGSLGQIGANAKALQLAILGGGVALILGAPLTRSRAVGTSRPTAKASQAVLATQQRVEDVPTHRTK